jgi:hypothetical protein
MGTCYARRSRIVYKYSASKDLDRVLGRAIAKGKVFAL